MTKETPKKFFARSVTGPVMAAAVLFASATPAAAYVSVKNTDKTDHYVTFDHGAKEIERKVGPGESIKEKCSDPCGVRIRVFGYDHIAQDGDKLMIKNNFVKPEQS